MGRTVSFRFSKKPEDQAAARAILGGIREGMGMKARKKESFKLEEDARDAAIKKVEGAHRGLVQMATEIARKLVKENGRVSSPQVWKVLWEKAAHEDGLRQELETADPRWMGAVFKQGQWRRIGWEAHGSHKRPVSVWELQPELPVG